MEFKPLSGRDFPRFSALKTFFRLPAVSMDEDFDVALFGIPFDGGASYRPGARFAPQAVREASSLGRGYHWPSGRNIFSELRVADIGDCPTVPINLEMTYGKIEEFVSKLLNSVVPPKVPSRKRFIAVGGDHSVTLPVLRSLRKSLGQPLSLIHFDAHLDTYPAAWECEYHHGSFLRHAVQEGLVNPKQIVQFGIRGPLAGGDDITLPSTWGMQSFTVDDIRKKGIFEFCKTLPQFAGPTYLTFDVDGLDPVFVPGTGTPVIGGLTSYEVQQILRHLRPQQLVGADIVEISPPYDHAQLTALLGVDVMFEILRMMLPAKV